MRMWKMVGHLCRALYQPLILAFVSSFKQGSLAPSNKHHYLSLASSHPYP
jgi:hypothetical protein